MSAVCLVNAVFSPHLPLLLLLYEGSMLWGCLESSSRSQFDGLRIWSLLFTDDVMLLVSSCRDLQLLPVNLWTTSVLQVNMWMTAVLLRTTTLQWSCVQRAVDQLLTYVL